MSIETLFDHYLTAFNGRQIETLVSLFSPQALFEMPLLGQRLFGTSEIRLGHQRMFDLTEFARLEIAAFKSSGSLIIAEGLLKAKLTRDPAAVEMPLAMTLENTERKISRLSVYLDARPYRLWADGPIFAPRETHAERRASQ